jgi:signal transduction histidine kinase
VASAAADKGGLGLASMRERAELLGGRFHVQSSSHGTSVHLSWPLPPDDLAAHRMPALVVAHDDLVTEPELVRAS